MGNGYREVKQQGGNVPKLNPRNAVLAALEDIRKDEEEIKFKYRDILWLTDRLWELHGINRETIEKFTEGSREERDNVLHVLETILSERQNTIVNRYLREIDESPDAEKRKKDFSRYWDETITNCLLVNFQKEAKISANTWIRYRNRQTYTSEQTASQITDGLQTMQGRNTGEESEKQKAEFEGLIHKQVYMKTQAMSEDVKKIIDDRINITEFEGKAGISQDAWLDFLNDSKMTSKYTLVAICLGLLHRKEAGSASGDSNFGEKEAKAILSQKCNTGFAIASETFIQAAIRCWEKSDSPDFRDYLVAVCGNDTINDYAGFLTWYKKNAYLG